MENQKGKTMEEYLENLTLEDVKDIAWHIGELIKYNRKNPGELGHVGHIINNASTSIWAGKGSEESVRRYKKLGTMQQDIRNMADYVTLLNTYEEFRNREFSKPSSDGETVTPYIKKCKEEFESKD